MPENNKTTSPAAAAEEYSTQQQQEKNNSNPFLNIFSNILNFFKSVLPPPQKEATKVSPVVVKEVEAKKKTSAVSFPIHNKDESLVSLKHQPDEIREPNTNPLVLWQVYAIGGFLVLRWSWTRWNERKSRKKPPSDEEPPPPPPPPAAHN